MMMGIRIGKEAGAGAQLKMRRSDPDLARGNEAGTGVVGDPAAGKIVAVGAGVEVARGNEARTGVVGDPAAGKIVAVGAGVEAVRGEDGAGAVTGGGVGVVKIVAAGAGVEA